MDEESDEDVDEESDEDVDEESDEESDEDVDEESDEHEDEDKDKDKQPLFTVSATTLNEPPKEAGSYPVSYTEYTTL